MPLWLFGVRVSDGRRIPGAQCLRVVARLDTCNQGRAVFYHRRDLSSKVRFKNVQRDSVAWRYLELISSPCAEVGFSAALLVNFVDSAQTLARGIRSRKLWQQRTAI